MPCPPGYYEGRASNLFGGASISPSGLRCLPESRYEGIGPLKIAQTVAGVVFPLVSIPGILENAPARGLAVIEDALDLSKQEKKYIDLGLSVAQTVLSSGASTEGFMGFFDSFDMSSIVDFGESLIEEVDWGQVASLGLETAQTFMPQTASYPYAIPVSTRGVQPVSAGSVPGTVLRGAGAVARTGAVVGRSFFNKWPNLATAIQKMRNAGQNVSRSKLYSMMRRFGPDFLITGGILSAAAVSELIMAGPGHRRMNVGNVKALRRGMRRIEGFHRLCTKADRLRRPKARVTVKSCR